MIYMLGTSAQIRINTNGNNYRPGKSKFERFPQ